MEDGQSHSSSDKFEVAKMIRVDAGCVVDLERIVVMRRVFEQAIARIENFMRQ